MNMSSEARVTLEDILDDLECGRRKFKIASNADVNMIVPFDNKNRLFEISLSASEVIDGAENGKACKVIWYFDIKGKIALRDIKEIIRGNQPLCISCYDTKEILEDFSNVILVWEAD